VSPRTASDRPVSGYRPQLAALARRPPAGDEWLHEIKFDGYRVGCQVRRGRATLTSRNGRDWTTAFPEIAAAAATLSVRDALLDGEVAMVLPDGRTSFQALQNASAGTASRAALVYFVFDLLRLDGRSLETLPLEERKARLAALLGRRATGRLRYADHVIGRGEAFFRHACRLGIEGIVSKRRDGRYFHGRHDSWLKTKCTRRQELVIGGFTDPQGARSGLGALLVGHYDRGRLTFAGKVGTGFTVKTALDLRRELDALARAVSPFDPPPPSAIARRAHWVTPALVCDVDFTEWTNEGRIRHPSFQGLRRDKAPREVVRERPRQPARSAGRQALL
jgi:bifunctional non-homologous end joining protein LigD